MLTTCGIKRIAMVGGADDVRRHTNQLALHKHPVSVRSNFQLDALSASVNPRSDFPASSLNVLSMAESLTCIAAAKQGRLAAKKILNMFLFRCVI